MNDSRKGWAAIGMAARSVALSSAQQRSAAHNATSAEQTKPTRPQGHGPTSDAQILLEAMGCDGNELTGPAARSAAHSGAQQRSAAHKPAAFEKPKPTGQSTGLLTSRQLAAARLAAQGLRSSEVASRLGTIPQTINRWKHLPQFQAELRRLHDMLVLQ